MLSSGYGTDVISENTTQIRTKSAALHVERKQPARDSAKRSCSVEREKLTPRLTTVTERAIDTPLDRTPILERSPAASLYVRPASSQSTQAIEGDACHGTSTPPAVSSLSTPRVPKLVQDYAPEPKFWVGDGPGAGQAAAEWRHNFVPILATSYSHMDRQERTEQFDKLVAHNNDRYTTAIVAYYGTHPSTIPDRIPSEILQRRTAYCLQSETPSSRARQQLLFHAWTWDTASHDTRPPSPRGPKDEPSPDDHAPACAHCAKLVQRAARHAQRRKTMDPIAAPLRRALSLKMPFLQRRKGSVPKMGGDSSRSSFSRSKISIEVSRADGALPEA